MIELGKEGRDKVTGFKGIVVSRLTYLFGCDQYGISPRVKDGKIAETVYIDEGRIEIIGEGINAKDVQTDKPGGVQIDCPK